MHSVEETIDRLEVDAKGLTVFVRIDHAAGRHGIAPQTEPVTHTLASALAALTKHAVGS